PPQLDVAAESVSAFFDRWPATEGLSELRTSIRERLSKKTLNRADLISVQSDVTSLSPTAHIISRTRKAEAIPNRPRREANVLREEDAQRPDPELRRDCSGGLEVQAT